LQDPARARKKSSGLAWRRRPREGAGLDRSLRPLLLALAAAALFGAAAPLCKPLLADLSPTLLAGLLYLGAAALLAPRALRERWPDLGEAGASLARLAGVVALGGALGPVLLLAALARAPAGSVALWLNLEVVATALLARTFFHEHLGARDGLAVLGVCAASLLLALPGHAGGAPVPALLLVAAACLCWALDNNWTSRIDAFTPAQTSFAKGLVAGGCNLALGLAGGAVPSPASAGFALAIGAACYGLSLVLLVTAAQQLGAARSQLAFATASLWGVALAWLVLGEPMLPVQVAAAALMGLALVQLTREDHSHWHLHDPVTHRHAHRHDDGHHDHTHPEGEPSGAHSHLHHHPGRAHVHPHRPDLHHRHRHGASRRD
jgi:drug/metabolite transporter (DMT)-like permease